MSADNTAGRRPAIGLVTAATDFLKLSANGTAQGRSGIMPRTIEIVKKFAAAVGSWRPSESLFEVTFDILKNPFSFGLHHFHRTDRQARDYLTNAGVIFLAATLLAWIAAFIWPDRTLFLAQAVVTGTVVAALAVGNLVALALARYADREVQTKTLATAALYGAGFNLLGLSAFKLVGLIGPALVPGYSGSLFEALTVLGFLGSLFYGAFLLIEWPRRIVALDERTYYAAVAGLFAAFGLLLKVNGFA